MMQLRRLPLVFSNGRETGSRRPFVFAGLFLILSLFDIDRAWPDAAQPSAASGPVVVAPEYRASEVEEITVGLGKTFRLESMRQAVVPPYFMLMPFIELPDFLELVAQFPLDEDGVHGVVFVIKAIGQGNGNLRLGFRDLQSEEITHEKSIVMRAR